MAALAGVSQATVSAAMSGNRAVAAETKQRIESAMQELGYQPNAGARTLRTSRTNVIALMVELSSQGDAIETVPYIESIIERAREREYDVVVVMANEGPAGLRRLIGRSICDAAILMDIHRDDARVPTAASLDTPTVLIGRPDDPHGLDAVDFDGRRAAELLVDELADTGHESALAIGEPPAGFSVIRSTTEFHEGLVRRARERGLQLEVLIPHSNRWGDVSALAAALESRRGERLGLIARTPWATEAWVRLLMQQDMRVGEDASLVALCGDDYARSFDVPVTNVSPVPREVTGRAMHVLFERLAGRGGAPVVDLVTPGTLNRRASTRRFDRA